MPWTTARRCTLLPLDDPSWTTLAGNYGPGTAVARLLSDAWAGAPQDAWYEELFQNLLHQDTLSPVAYAAVPHLVEIAGQRAEGRVEMMVLVGACYAHSGEAEAPALPAALRPAWDAAREDSVPMVLDMLREPGLTETAVRYLLAALAALRGHAGLALALETLDVDIQCPRCGEWIPSVLTAAGDDARISAAPQAPHRCAD